VLKAIAYIRNAIHIVVSELFAENSARSPGKRCLLAGSGAGRVQTAAFHSAHPALPEGARETDIHSNSEHYSGKNSRRVGFPTTKVFLFCRSFTAAAYNLVRIRNLKELLVIFYFILDTTFPHAGYLSSL
jgi:hypothetical protein